MAEANSSKTSCPAERVHSPLGALLSYLVPGLGQIYQGRLGKGLLFLICIPGMFFYGMALGEWKNVYLPDATNLPQVTFRGTVAVGGPLKALYYRFQFAGQFWVGSAAWPAIWQYLTYDPAGPRSPLGNFERAPDEEDLNKLQRNSDKRWDLAWVYTVIAGVLNILVIYDAYSGPLFPTAQEAAEDAEADS